MRGPLVVAVAVSIFGLADTLAPRTRRAALASCASAAASALVSGPALAGDLYYTKRDFCVKSDAENRNGIDFGCEAFATDPAKRSKMRRRALERLESASARLDRFDATTMSKLMGARLREALRTDPLDAIRAQGRVEKGDFFSPF